VLFLNSAFLTHVKNICYLMRCIKHLIVKQDVVVIVVLLRIQIVLSKVKKRHILLEGAGCFFNLFMNECKKQTRDLG
jgi:hypothetical protein